MLYSLSHRRRVLALQLRDGLTNQETADHFGIGIATVARSRSRIEPKPYPQRKPYKIDMAALAEDVRLHPDAYQSERAARFGVTVQAICHGLKGLGVTYKKALTHPKADAAARHAFRRRLARLEKLGRPIVYVDESGFSHDMARTHGYAPRGERCCGIRDL